MRPPVRPSLVAALLAGCGILAAQSTPPPPDPALRARFGFHGPLVHKLADAIDLLTVAPLPDGRHEILVHNGRRGRIDRLQVSGQVQGDTLPQISETSVAIPYEASGLATGDVDADGDPELVLLDANGRLSAPGHQPPLAPIDVGRALFRGALALGDLDGDRRADAVVLTRDGVVVVLDPAGQPRVSRADPISAQRVRAFHLQDLDRDGRLDLVVATNEERMPLRVRLGRGDGSFGPWLLFDVPSLYDAFAGTGAGGRPSLALVTSDRRVLELQLEAASPEGRAVQLTTLAESKQPALAHAQGDLDGDGDDDLVIAEPERARVTLFLEQDGRFELRSLPALAGVTSLALGDLDGDRRPDLVLVSPEEKTLAWLAATAKEGTFPQAIPVPDIPVAATVASDRSLLVLARNDKLQGKLYRVRRGGENFSPPEDLGPVGRIGSDPHRLLLADLDGNDGPELAFVVRGDGLRILRGKPDGGFAPDDAFEAGFTKKIEDGALELVDEAGRPALMIVRDRYLRRMRLGAGSRPDVLAQENGPEGAGQLDLAARRKDGATVILDRAANKLYRLSPGQAPISIDVPAIGAFRLLWHGDDALIAGNRGVVRVPFAGGYALRAVRNHERLLEKTNWWKGIAADLDSDRQPELVLLDEHLHGVHVLVAEPQKLVRALSFPVFELPEAGKEVYEPRALASADVDGDGRNDLILIAHDRVLIYLQEP